MSLNSIFQYFVPKDKKVFFPLFEHAASNVVTMATVLVETVNSNNAVTREDLIKQIDKLENKGDEITHQIHLELEKTLSRPLTAKIYTRWHRQLTMSLIIYRARQTG